MPILSKSAQDTGLMIAALEGLELQKKRIEEQIRQVRAFLSGRKRKLVTQPASAGAKPAQRRQLSAAARKRIAMAQKRRWAEYRKKASAAKE